MKKSYLLPLLIGFTALIGCQEDIPLLGEEGDTIPKSEVFIRSIVLSSFPQNDPNTSLPWDDGVTQPFDPQDSIGPDIFYKFYHKSDQGTIMSFQQPTHFSNILPLNVDSPLVYYFTEPFQIFPEYVDTTFYLTMYDLDFTSTDTTSTYMDSIPFSIGPDNTLPPPDKYITSKSGFGFNGSYVTLGLEWK